MFGRGRGGRGGRGRGFPTGPVAKDDEGNALPAPNQPPSLFPPANLPPLPTIHSHDDQLLARRRRLANGWRQSPYFLELPKPKPVGVDAEMERYSDKYRRKPQMERVPLASVMTLIPKYFPPELYVRRAPLALPSRGKNKAALAQLSAEATWGAMEGKAGDDLMRLERLMTAEKKAAESGAAGSGDKDADAEAKRKKPGDELFGDDDAEQEEEEEVWGEDDDYAQGPAFDDDEEYDDDGGGGDDEAVY